MGYYQNRIFPWCNSVVTGELEEITSRAVLSAIRGEGGIATLEKIQISLAAARVNAGLTQEDVAKLMKVSKQTIINWEKGRVVIGIPEIEMLARIYKIPQDNIFLPY